MRREGEEERPDKIFPALLSGGDVSNLHNLAIQMIFKLFSHSSPHLNPHDFSGLQGGGGVGEWAEKTVLPIW